MTPIAEMQPVTSEAELAQGRPGPPPTGWPAPLGRDAMHGLVGDVVRTIAPHTEADPAALAIQFLVAFGSVVGRKPHFRVGATRHGSNLFVTMVGPTGEGRKGTGWNEIAKICKLADPKWQIASGLSSGEGLIWSVRDEVVKEGKDGAMEVVVSGVDDKRLLVTETEFASVLKVMDRQGNTLSPVVRNAWDDGFMSTLTKNNPAKATDAHISIIGHVTPQEVVRYLTTTEAANGLANRFLWACTRRSKYLPDGGSLGDAGREELAAKVSAAAKYAAGLDRLRRTEGAGHLWASEYPRLCTRPLGLLGAVTGRAEAQVLRLAMLYALLSQKDSVDLSHLRAALEVWRYCADSARFVFGDSLGDPTADEILRALRTAGAGGMTRTAIRDLFGRHRGAQEIDRALVALMTGGLARSETLSTGGRPSESWRAAP